MLKGLNVMRTMAGQVPRRLCGLLMLGGLAGGLGSGLAGGLIPGAIAQPVVQRYPEAVRDNYLSSCIKNETQRREFCECTLKRLEARYTAQQFRILDQRLRNQQPVPSDLFKIISDCRKQPESGASQTVAPVRKKGE